MSESHFFEQKDGSKIAYKILKSENVKNEIPLVLIMGLHGTKEHFWGFEEELAKSHTVIIFDNRGIGESTVISHDNPITIEQMAQDTIELIKYLEIKRFNLYGVSMGGMIALCVASNIPSDLKLEKLIIGAGFARVREESETYKELNKRYELPEMNLPKNIQEQKNELLSSDKNWNRYQIERPDRLDKIAEMIVNVNNRRPFEIFKRQWEAIKQCNLISNLKIIKAPTLLIHGEADEIVPIQESELLDREIPETQFHRIPNAGHCIYEFAPESVNIMNEFLNN